jgi:DNA mismatch repair protein MutS
VARLAGLPESVLARARALLAELESGKVAAPRKKKKQEDQLALFQAKDVDPETLRALVDTLRGLELDRMTGLDALSLLARWKGKV